jgi:putative transposase
MDLFRCESIVLQSYWVMVIIDVFIRRFIGFAVERGDIDGAAVCRMFNAATVKQDPPKYLSSDNDLLFRFHRWRANLRVMDIEEIKSLPFVPRSHPFVERMIRTIREELLDQVLVWNRPDLNASFPPSGSITIGIGSTAGSTASLRKNRVCRANDQHYL